MNEAETSQSSSMFELVYSNSYALCGTVLLSALLLWRVYRFTITPLIYPHGPKEYPYWIPLVGHLRSFFKNSCQLLEESRLYFKDTRAPFSLSVAGQTWYILTHPVDVTSTYKIKDGSLSYDIFVEEVMGMMGITKDGVRKAFYIPSKNQTPSEKFSPTPSKHLVTLCKEYQTVQLSPGSRFDELVNPALKYISNRLTIDSILRHNKSASPGPDKSVTVSLYHFISEVFIGMGQNAYFGNLLGDIEPNMVTSFMTFDRLAWQIIYQYPSILCGEVLTAKNKMAAAFEKYFTRAEDERPDAAWMIKELEKDMKRLEVAPHDMALFYLQLYWSICGNIKKAPFWLLSYALFNPSLLNTIRTETAPAITPTGIDIQYLLTSCPNLEALWSETLRLTAFAASVRFLTRDITLPNSPSGPLILRKGNRIMMPQRQLHFNTNIFGPNAAEFEAERFIENPKLSRHGSYRPFGGGATLCPGRHLAKIASLAFVAMLLDRFEVSVEGGVEKTKFPVPTEGIPSIGLVDVVPGSDLRVVMKEREGR